MAKYQGNITVSPGVRIYVDARIKQLGLRTASAYFAILVHNYLHGPFTPLPIVERPAKVVKVRIQLTLPRAVRREVMKAAKRLDMSLSQLVEALTVFEADRDDSMLFIYSANRAEKPILKLP